MTNEELFKKLLVLQESGVRGSHITSDGYFKYHHNMPIVDDPANLLRVDQGVHIWNICRNGDIFLSFKIEGVYDYAELYQYCVFGSKKIIYWRGHSDDHVAPFEDGIPLMQMGKSIYIAVYGANLEETKVSVRFAMLDTPSRGETAIWSTGDGHGVKITHKDGTTYQVLHVCDCGHSPNTLMPMLHLPKKLKT